MKKLCNPSLFVLAVLVVIAFSCSKEDVSSDMKIESKTDFEKLWNNQNITNNEDLIRSIRERIWAAIERDEQPLKVMADGRLDLINNFNIQIDHQLSKSDTSDVASKKEEASNRMTLNDAVKVSELTNVEQEQLNITSNVVNRAIVEVQFVYTWVWKVIRILFRHLQL